MTATLSDRIRARLEVVEEHVRRENAHDLPGIMTTFGHQAWYDDEPGVNTMTAVMQSAATMRP
jgi:hypothetical protein